MTDIHFPPLFGKFTPGIVLGLPRLWNFGIKESHDRIRELVQRYDQLADLLIRTRRVYAPKEGDALILSLENMPVVDVAIDFMPALHAMMVWVSHDRRVRALGVIDCRKESDKWVWRLNT